jgi:hypothetical protein
VGDSGRRLRAWPAGLPSRDFLLDPGRTEMVGIGIVGIGFMGMIHYLAARGWTGGA